MTTMTLTFDTHSIIKKFRDKGLSEDLAEYQVEAIKDMVNQAIVQVQHDYKLDELATKRDLKELEAATKRDIKELEAATKRDLKELELKLDARIKEVELKIAETKTDLVRWIFTVGVGMGLVQIASIVFLVLKLSGQG